MSIGILIVVSGPSAVGKDTVLDKLLSTEPPNLRFPAAKCITATTRDPRPKDGGMEVHGVDYLFCSVPGFNDMVEKGHMLEYAEVHGHYYGVPRDWVVETLKQGTDVVLRVDVQGAKNVKAKFPEAVLVFMKPPSMEELERRLRSRKSETEESIARRLLNARVELEQAVHYDYSVVNDTIEVATDTFCSIILAEHCRVITSR